jgi:hypothetical protein
MNLIYLCKDINLMEKKTTYIRQLFSTDEKEVLAALAHLTENGYPEIAADLTKLYSETSSLVVKENTIYILNNLKNKNSVSHFIKGLKLVQNKESRINLISACWQNGLDYSIYLDYFIDIVATESINHAIEAFSVIECNLPLLDNESLKKLKTHIINVRKSNKIENLKLFEEIEKLIE